MFSGASAPEGWALCTGGSATARDGSNLNIPDLTNRFIVGAGSTYSVNQTGGSDSITIDEDTDNNDTTPTATHDITATVQQHTLTESEIPSHTHSIGHGHGVQVTNGQHAHGFSDKFLHDGGTGDYDNSKENSEQDGHYRFDQKQTQQAATNVSVQVQDAPNTTQSGSAGDGNGHNHSTQMGGGVTLQNTTHQHPYDFTFDNRPQYYALAYIIKL